MSNSGIPVISDVARTAGNLIDGSLKVVENIIKNPLPTVTMVAATWALGPYGLAVTSSTATAAALASGAIAASKGKNIGDIAKSALLAFGSSEFAKYTGLGDLTSEIGSGIGGTSGSAVASGLNNAFFNSSVAALGGKNVGEAFGAGFLGGAAGSLAGSAMSSQMGQSVFGDVKSAFGLNDSQMKYIQGGATAMGAAAISGQDPQVALTNYIAQNIVNIGKTELGKQFTSAKEAFITSKLDLEQEADNQQQIINTRNALYEEAKPVLDQYTDLSNQYKDAANKVTEANDYIQKNRGGYDYWMMLYNNDKASYAKKYGMVLDNEGNLGTMGWDAESGQTFYRSDINDSFGPSQSNIENINNEANKLKPYTDVIDKYRPTIETLRPKLEELNTKLADYSTKFNGYDADIQASNDKITKLSDTFADRAAEFEKTSKQVGTSLVDTATSDIELANIKQKEEAAREVARQEEERQNTLRIEEERRRQEEQQPPSVGPEDKPPPVEVPGEDGGTLKVDPKTGGVTVTEPELPATEPTPTEPPATEQPFTKQPPAEPETKLPPAKPDITNTLENAGLQPPGAKYDINDTDIGSEIGSETVTTSPGEEPLADLSKSGVMMPDGSYKTWAELDELAGVPPGTIYTDGGSTITEQELLDIINGTYTPRGTTTQPIVPKPTTPAPKPTTPTTQPVTQPAQPVAQPAQQTNPLGMLALLDILGQQPQQQPQQPQQQGADIRLMEDIFGTNLYTPRPEGTKKYSSGGEIEALLQLLRS